VQWIRQVSGGLHQCGLCGELVGWKDVYPKPEDLTEDFRSRWKAHEAAASSGSPAGPVTPSSPA
jgi:hypothetical protein